jgi:hypothetical protein
LSTSETTYDTQLTAIAEDAESIVQERLNRIFESSSKSDTFTGDDTNEYIFKHYPVTAVTALWKYDEIDAEWDELVEGTDFDGTIVKDYLYKVNDIIFSSKSLYKITYTAGYTTLPIKFKLALKDVFKVLLADNSIGNNDLGIKQITIPSPGGSENIVYSRDDLIDFVLARVMGDRDINV